jgi:hypothetical protein
MNPPAGRIQIGDRVEVPGRRTGQVVSEQLTISNGSWRYGVKGDDGTTTTHLDYELKKLG